MNESQQKIENISHELENQADTIKEIISILGSHVGLSKAISDRVLDSNKSILKIFTILSTFFGILLGVALANSRILNIIVDRYKGLSQDWQLSIFNAIILALVSLLSVGLGFILKNRSKNTSSDA